jgi:hypothetical protein
MKAFEIRCNENGGFREFKSVRILFEEDGEL